MAAKQVESFIAGPRMIIDAVCEFTGARAAAEKKASKASREVYLLRQRLFRSARRARVRARPQGVGK